MVDIKLIQRFIQGQVSDEEAAICEQYLSDSDSAPIESLVVSQAEQETLDDDLVAYLMASPETIEPCPDATQQINSSIKHRLESGDVTRFLRPAEADDEIGRLGHYRILSRIGSGGMGIVFRAQSIAEVEPGDKSEPNVVALKLMNPMMATNAQTAERFHREVRSAAKLSHRRIVDILDVGSDNGIPFFTMNLLTGQSLRQHLDHRGRLTPEEATAIAWQIAEGLDFANTHGILHRDIKPDNIWLDESGDVIILDFGLARGADESIGLTNTGDAIGTPRYMAPEQVQGQKVDHRSDLFSLGCVLYEMLTGRSKFGDANVYSTMMAVIQNDVAIEELTEIGCPKQLAAITCRLLEKDRQQRFGSAASLMEELSQLKLGDRLQRRADTNGFAGSWRTWALGCAVVVLSIMMAVFTNWPTDTGTLLIEYGQHSELKEIELSFFVREVKSGKIHAVSMGENQLPTGAYKVVLNPDSTIILSEQTFVLRSGETNTVLLAMTNPKQFVEHARVKEVFTGIDKWFAESKYQSSPDRVNITLGEVVLKVENELVFNLTARLNIEDGKAQVVPVRHYFNLDYFYDMPIDVVRDGETIGVGTIVNGIDGKQYDQSELRLVAKLIPESIDQFTKIQLGDVVVIAHSKPKRKKESYKMVAANSDNDDLPKYKPRPFDMRGFLRDTFPSSKHFYVGTISHQSEKNAIVLIDSFYDLNATNFRMGDEGLSNHCWKVPALDGQQFHFLRGAEKVASGRLKKIFGNHDEWFAQVEPKASDQPIDLRWNNSRRRWDLIVIPISEERLFPGPK